jgi:hypothetical protein
MSTAKYFFFAPSGVSTGDTFTSSLGENNVNELDSVLADLADVM